VLRRPAPDSLWADQEFRRYWTSRVVSYFGGVITFVAAPVLVYALSGSALLTGVATATEGLPYLLFGLLAGALSDRVDRQRLMVSCDVVNAALLVTIPIAAALDRLTVAQVLVVGFLSSTVFVFFDAANFGALPTLVGRDRIRLANSAVWGSTQVFDVVVPGLVGIAVAVVRPSSLYWINAFTFLASAALLRGIRRSMSGDRSDVPHRLRDDILTGVRWLWAHPTLRPLTILGTATTFAFGGVMGQLVPFADQVIGVRQGDARLGAVFAAFSLGGLVGTLTHRWLKPFAPVRVSLVSLSFASLFLLLLPWPHDWRVSLVLVFCIGVVNLVSVINVITYRQEETPEDMQGRVNTTARMLSWGLGSPIGAFVCGLIASRYGSQVGVAFAAVAMTVATSVAWRSSLGRVPARRPVRDVVV
jgi:MFS family permease